MHKKERSNKNIASGLTVWVCLILILLPVSSYAEEEDVSVKNINSSTVQQGRFGRITAINLKKPEVKRKEVRTSLYITDTIRVYCPADASVYDSTTSGADPYAITVNDCSCEGIYYATASCDDATDADCAASATLYTINYDITQDHCECLGKTWATGGESSTFGNYTSGIGTGCCDDDAGENVITETNGTDAPSPYADGTGTTCCDASTDCTESGTNICTATDTAADTKPAWAYCGASNTWYGGDASQTACDVIVGVDYWGITGGESSAFGGYDTGSETECCGDDTSENYETAIFAAVDGSNIPGWSVEYSLEDTDDISISSHTSTVCCNSGTDCVWAGTCYNPTGSDLRVVEDTGYANNKKIMCFSPSSGVDVDNGVWLDCDGGSGYHCGGGSNTCGYGLDSNLSSGESSTHGGYDSGSTDGVECCGDDSNEHKIVAANKVLDTGGEACCDDPSDCSYNNTCYDSMPADNWADYYSSPYNITVKLPNNDTYKCINELGTWRQVYPRLTWEGHEHGYCRNESECLVDQGSTVYDISIPSSWHLNEYGLGERPDISCIKDGEFIGDHYCDNGNWTTRTMLLADALLNKSSNNFTIFCGSYENAVNYLNYEILLTGGPRDVESFLDNSTPGKKINSVCILRDLTDNNKTVIGTSLNQPSGVFDDDYPLLYVFNKVYTICDGVNDIDEYQECGAGSDIYYNPKKRIMIYSPVTSFLTIPGVFGVIIDFFKGIFDALIGGKTHFTEVFNIFEYRSFNQLYFAKIGNKDVTAIRGLLYPPAVRLHEPPYYFMSINYTNFGSNICDSVIAYRDNIGIPGGTTIDCTDVSVTEKHVIIDTRDELYIDNIWLDLTAKMRP